MEDHLNQHKESFLSFTILKLVYNYMIVNKIYTFKFNVEDFEDDISVNIYSFPSSFLELENDIKQNGFETAYEVLNGIHKKINIEEEINQSFEYHFFHIQFYSKPAKKLQKYLKPTLEKFFIFFCSKDTIEERNDFRILYNNRLYYDYVLQLLDSTYLDLNNVNEFQKSKIEILEIVLEKICKFLQITIPENIKLFKENSAEPGLEDYEEFVKLVSRGKTEKKELEKQAKKLFENYKNGTHDDNYEDEVIIDGHFEFFQSINAWNSDWRIDPKDAEYFFSKMIGENLNVEFPEETYNDDLFPYIKSALEKRGFELMTYETYGDSYLFFVVNKDEVQRILELSELTKIEIHQL